MASNKNSGELIELAKTFLKHVSQGEREESLETLTEYVECFELWDNADTDKTKAELERVSKIHTEVLEAAKTMQSESGKALKALRHRGKGLRAYVDPLPTRVSFRKPRKG